MNLHSWLRAGRAARARNPDAELERYRGLLDTPTEFKDGFGWSTVAGILFCGLIMMPGSIYLSLMTGGGMGSAATWVTLILFNEVARRALKALSKQELVVLLHAAGGIMGGQFLFGDFVYRAFLVSSEAIRDAGMRDVFPAWYVPRPDSPALLERNLFDSAWFVPIALLAFLMVIGLIKRYTLGYFFFRLCSDIEKLPFPMAPVQAQGAMALAEAEGVPAQGGGDAPSDAEAGRAAFPQARPGERKGSQRWRLFALGLSLGVAFGLIQVGVPALTGLILDKPFFILPQPFLDTTTLTEGLLPAVPTGMTLDLGIVLIGMVVPFWAVVGTCAAIVGTVVLNPILRHAGILARWQPGMDTINTTFSNSVDFWMSFGIGAALGIALVSIYQTVRDVRRRWVEVRARRALQDAKEPRRASLWETPNIGRGDYPMWIALAGYIFTSVTLIVLCDHFLKDTGTSRAGILSFLIVFTFLYNPLISYINARLIGISGQSVDVPFMKESAFMLSGAKGVDVWLAPIPIANYGAQAQGFRVNELTGVSFRSLMKADLVVLPVMFVLSWVFWAFIWHSAPVPSDAFPSAQINWELRAKSDALLFSSTFVADPAQKESNIRQSQFMEAIHPKVIAAAAAVTVGLFAALSVLGLPVMFVYGIVRGLGQLPHYMVLEIVGALLGRFYFKKRFGEKRFLQIAPTVLAGYFTGVGLTAMATIALRLIQSAVSAAPF
jgi:hypothetical protein